MLKYSKTFSTKCLTKHCLKLSNNDQNVREKSIRD